MRPRDRFIAFSLVFLIGTVSATFKLDKNNVIIDDADRIGRVRPFENRLILRLDTDPTCDYLFALCFKHRGGDQEGICPAGFCEIAATARRRRIVTKKGVKRVFESAYIEIEVTPTGLEVYRGDEDAFENSVTVDSCIPEYDEHGYLEISVPYFKSNCTIILPQTDLDVTPSTLPYIEYLFIEIVIIAAAILVISTGACLVRARSRKNKRESSAPNVKGIVSREKTLSPAKLHAKNLESERNQANIEKIVISSSTEKKKLPPPSQSASKSSIAEVKPRGATSGKVATPKRQSRVTLSKSSEKMPRKAQSPFKKLYY